MCRLALDIGPSNSSGFIWWYSASIFSCSAFESFPNCFFIYFSLRLQRSRRKLNLEYLEPSRHSLQSELIEKSQTRLIRPSDVHTALGREIAYTISNDPQLMRAAVDRGVPISEIKRKSAIGKDLDLLDSGIAAALGLER